MTLSRGTWLEKGAPLLAAACRRRLKAASVQGFCWRGLSTSQKVHVTDGRIRVADGVQISVTVSVT